MSLTNEWFEFHLTSAGWVAGSEKLDFGGGKNVPTPEGRVFTIRCHIFQSCSFADEKRWCEEVFRSDDAALVQELLERLGNRPDKYRNWPDTY